MKNNNSATLLNEGAIQDLVRSIFGRNFKTSVGSAAEVLLNKALNDVVSGGRRFAINSLRKTPEFKKAFVDLTAEASRVKYGKSFDDLVKFDKNAAQKLTNDLQTGIEKEIAEKAAAGKNLVDADVKAAKSNLNKVSKDVNAGKATAKDLKNATKEFDNAVKMQSKWGEAQKTLAGMDKMTIGKIQKLLSQEAKVTTGTGASLSKSLGNNVVIKTMKGIFKTTKDALKNFPGKIKKVIVNNKMLSALTAAGLGAAALYYFFNSSDDTAVVLVDENGNPLDDNSKTNWGPCLSYMLKNKEAELSTTKTGQIGVTTPASEKYPSGLRFYPNGRIMNLQSRDMGTWTCTAGQAEVSENMGKNKLNESIGQIVKRVLNERYVMEQSASQIDSDVEDLIDYLDVPVWGNDYKNIAGLLKKYASNGKFNEFKEVYEEAGFMKTSLRSDISSIYAIDASSVRAKKEILALLDQIESGKYVQAPSPSTPNNNTKKPQKVRIIGEQGDLNIVWDKDKGKAGGDGGNSGGGGGGSTKTKKYYDCTNVNIDTTPLTYGCKSSKIGEIQKCLGVSVDNKFGPLTREALIDNAYDMSKGITKEIYTKILAACNPSTTQTTGSTEGGADVGYLRNPIKLDLTPTPELPKFSRNTETNEDFYNRLVANGNFRAGEIGSNRVKYKGTDLNASDLSKLNDYITSKGYRFIKSKDKGAQYDGGENDKYVWQKTE
jgi:hypothetical protein